MKKIDRYFVALGVTYLVIGMGLGLHMGAIHNFELAPVHAHINLVGFTLHAIFGVAYRLWPELSARNLLAKIHSWLFIGATPFFLAGIYLTIRWQSEGLVIAASFVLFGATLAFLVNVWRLVADA
jgi:hypothetical protein